MRRLMPIVLGVALLVPQSAFSWNSRGHMVFMVAATWADRTLSSRPVSDANRRRNSCNAVKIEGAFKSGLCNLSSSRAR